MTLSLTDWVSQSGYFYFWHTKSNPKDMWPLRHLIRLMRKHDLTNIYFSFFCKIFTMQRQSWTLETLITILTIENLNSDHLCDLTIKSDAGQHLQFLRCLWRWALKYYNKVPFTFSIFMYFRNKLNFYWFSFFRYSFKFSKTKLTLLMWPWHVMMVWQN